MVNSPPSPTYPRAYLVQAECLGLLSACHRFLQGEGAVGGEMDARTLKGKTHSAWQLTVGGPRRYREGSVKHDASIFSMGKGLFREYMLGKLRAQDLKSGCILAMPVRFFTLNKLLC